MTTETTKTAKTNSRKIEIVQQGSIYVARRDAVPSGYEYVTDGAFGRPVIGARSGEARECDSESEARQAVARLMAAPTYPEVQQSIARRMSRPVVR